MAEISIISSIKRYLTKLNQSGVPDVFGILFGSYSKINGADEWSDIDLLVISPLYDESLTRDHINHLWKIAAKVDSRIEPIPVGKKQWETDDISYIIEVARREGIVIYI